MGAAQRSDVHSDFGDDERDPDVLDKWHWQHDGGDIDPVHKLVEPELLMAVKKDAVVIVGALVDGPLLFSDNLTAHCTGCGRMIQFRPHAPKGDKVCIECSIPLMAIDGALLTTTPRMLEDFKRYLRSKMQ